VADEGGWLGPATDAAEQSWRADPDSTTEAPFPTRRFDGRDPMPTGSDRRNGLVLVLVAVAVLAVASASTLLLTARDRQTVAPPSATGTPTRFITAQAAGAPRDVRVTADRGTAVTIAWTDPTSATVSFVVVGTGPAGEELETKAVSRGTTTVTFAGLSSLKNYCFVVGAVYAVDRVATATEVCTRRLAPPNSRRS